MPYPDDYSAALAPDGYVTRSEQHAADATEAHAYVWPFVEALYGAVDELGFPDEMDALQADDICALEAWMKAAPDRVKRLVVDYARAERRRTGITKREVVAGVVLGGV
jgi:hypothetical protein